MPVRSAAIRAVIVSSILIAAMHTAPGSRRAQARGDTEGAAAVAASDFAPPTKAGGPDRAHVAATANRALPAGPMQGCGISGRVTDAGAPAPGIALELYEHKPGARNSTIERGRSITDAEGRYRFPPIRSLESGRTLYVRYYNKRSDPAVDDRRLAAWYGADVHSLSPEGCADGGEFDLADVALGKPGADAHVVWGSPITWEARTLPAERDLDTFQVCFADWTSREQFACVPDRPRPGYRYSPSAAERPATIRDGVELGWYLLVAGDGDAFGYSRWQRRIVFVPAPSATPTYSPSPTARRTPTPGSGPTLTVPPVRTTEVPVEPSSTPPPPDATMVCPGDVVKGLMDVHLPDAPQRADVLLAFDASSSMDEVIAASKANAQQIVDALRAVVPDTRFAVAYFRDYSDDEVYRLVQPMTTDAGALAGALGAFGAEGGGDSPEAYTRALFEAYDDPDLAWRRDARRFVVVFGDELPHDDDLNAGITAPVRNPGGSWCGDSGDCFKDAGRDRKLGTADDLDFQTVLAELHHQEITLLFVVTVPPAWPGRREVMVAYWSQWTQWTGPGGRAVALENTADLPRTIADLVRSASARIGRLMLEAQPPAYAGWLVARPDEMRDVIVPAGGSTVVFDFEIKVPETAAVPSTHVITLRALGDGAVYAERRIVLHVPEICIKPPTVQPSGHFIIGVPESALRDFPGTWSSVGRQLRRSGPASGRANSALQVQNLDGERTLNARAYFFPQRIPYTRAKGSPPPQAFPVEMLGVPPGASYNMFLPRLSLPFGIFSAVMLDDIDLPLAAVVRTDWTETGAAALYSSVRPSYELMVPVAVRRYYGQTSVISVMSDGNDRPVDVELSFYRSGSATPVSPVLRFELQPYEGATFDLLDQQPAFLALGDGFVGSARLRTVYGPDPGRTDDGAWIGAVSHVNIGSSKRAVWGFEAQPSGLGSSTAAEKLFVPLWRSRQRGTLPGDLLDTGIAVVNPNDRAEEVVIDFFPTDNLSASDACRSLASFSTAPVSIAPHSNHVFYQGPGGGSFPANCFGSAVVRTTHSGDTVLAVVNDAQNLSQLSAAYNAVPAGDATTKIAVPLFRNRHGRNELTTGIQVMNTGERTARVHIDFISPIGSGGTLINGCGIACDAVVPPMRAYTFYPPAIEAIAPNTVGSAIIESSENAAVVVIDFPLKGCCVDSAAYLGLPWFDKPEPGKGPSDNIRRNPSPAEHVGSR